MEQATFKSHSALHAVLTRFDFVEALNEVVEYTFKKNKEAAFIVYGGKNYYMVSEVTKSKNNARTLIPINLNTVRERGLAMIVHSHPMRTNEWVKHNLPAKERTVPSAQDIKTAENLEMDYPGVVHMIVTPSDEWDKDTGLNIFIYRRKNTNQPNLHHQYMAEGGEKNFTKSMLMQVLANSGFGYCETTSNKNGHYELDLSAKLINLFDDTSPATPA